jgi:hypothetical protein
MGKTKEFKDSVEYHLKNIYINIGIDVPRNHQDILDFVAISVSNDSDIKRWSMQDVARAFRKWIESQSKK